MPDISIAKRQAALQMDVVAKNFDEGWITLQHSDEDGRTTLITIPMEEWAFLFPDDSVMVDLIITRIGVGETVQ